MRRIRRVCALIGALCGALSIGLAYNIHRLLDAPGPLAAARDVVVPRGDHATVAQALRGAGVLRDVRFFDAAALMSGGRTPLRAGEFAFPQAASLRMTLDILRTAAPVQHRLTIPEGWTERQIVAALDAEPALAGTTPLIAEGEILPQTYFFTRDTPREALVARARDTMARALNEAWAGRAVGLPLADADALRTLASIIERETARDDERPLVAAALLNRLKLGMKLQSDPTVIFAVSGGAGVLDRRLSHADLLAANPFNTYVAPGLPPTPICTPGIASLKAAANPAQSEALYFVADGKGGHAFAKTLAEHNRNVTRFRSIEAGAAP